MKKQFFISQVKQNLEALQPFLEKEISFTGHYFSKQSGRVCFFVAEIEETVEALLHQNDVLHSEFYAEKLIKQFDALNKAVEKIKNEKKTLQFKSSFQFSPHIHRLPLAKRLQEYRRILRALNEKISWLMEQNYLQEDEHLKTALKQQIVETEQRKKNCLKVIEDLEYELQFK